MGFWYPIIPLRNLPALIRTTLLGALFAGGYGAVHDQISYSISPEYFTKMKFHQFAYADFGLPERVFAAEVGFLGSWWVGLIGGWLLARSGLAELTHVSHAHFCKAFGLVAAVAALCAASGVLLALFMTRDGELASWSAWRDHLGLEDVRAFAVVAYLHWASYLGGLLGMVCAVVYVKRQNAKQFCTV